MSSLIFGNLSIENFFENLVIKNGQVHINEIYRLCDLARIKHETATRKLRRKCEEDKIMPIYNLKGVVIGYRLKNRQNNLL